MLNRNRRSLSGILLALIMTIAAVNVFTGLGSLRIHNWDEARHGVSACEMMESGNYIVNTYNFEPDYWNAKPVLSFYCNLIGMKIFGKNIFGFRAVSAFCYLLIAALTFLLLYREAGAAAALAGTAAFIVSPTNWAHSFRSGDPDAVFMLCCFASFVCLWFSTRKKRLLYPAAFFLGLAFLAKSFHVGVPCILTLIFILFHWKKYTWHDLLIAAASGAMPVLIWAVLRYHADGWIFFQNMLERDLLGRLEGGHLCEHSYSPWYTYFGTLNHYLIIIPLIAIAVFITLGMCFRGKKCFSSAPDALGKWAGSFFLLYLAFYSCCRVKISWYIFPALLYLPVVFGVCFGFACRWLQEELVQKRNRLFLLPPLAILLTCIVWIFIGEGKAIRNLVKIELQQDVLTSENGGAAYRGATFYCFDPNGNQYEPQQKFLLVLRFLDAKAVMKNVSECKDSKEHTFLICTFENIEDSELRDAAEAVASKYSLKLIRCASRQALYSR